MADINKDGGFMMVEDQIGTLSIEGLSSLTTHSAVKHLSDDCCASVYLGETLTYDVVVKRHPDLDQVVWRKTITRSTSQATVLTCVDPPETNQSDKTGSGSNNVVIVETNGTEANGLICPVLATFVGNSSSGQVSDDVGASYTCDPKHSVFFLSWQWVLLTKL